MIYREVGHSSRPATSSRYLPRRIRYVAGGVTPSPLTPSATSVTSATFFRGSLRWGEREHGAGAGAGGSPSPLS